TMTQNKMTVTHIWCSGHTWTVPGTGYRPEGNFYRNGEKILPLKDKSLNQMLTFGLLCNYADLKTKEKEMVMDGDPTEGALLVAAMKAGLHRQQLLQQFTIEKEIPFDSVRKMMSVVVKDQQGRRFVITKGAPDVLIKRSTSVLWNEKKHSITEERETQVKEAINHLAAKALRMIEIAYTP